MMLKGTTLGACAGVITASLILRHLKSQRRKGAARLKPQAQFGKVLTDTSNTPFLHLSSNLTSLQEPEAQQIHPLAALIAELTFSDQDSLKRYQITPQRCCEETSIFVQTRTAFEEVVRSLAGADVIGVDIEHNHTRSYNGMICLVQLYADGLDYIIDALELHDSLDKLRPIFADPKIVKVFHGGDNDVLWLQRDFHIYTANLFDTEKAASVLGLKERSLQALLQEYMGVDQDKSHQLDDWRQRPLTQAMLMYAMTDAHYLPYLAAILRKELLETCNNDGTVSADLAFQRSQAVSLELYKKTFSKGAAQHAFAGILRKSSIPNSKSGGLEEKQQHKLAALCQWRDRLARLEDEGVQYIMSNSLIADLASSEIHSRTDADILLESRLDDCSASVSDFFSSCTGQRRIDLLEELAELILYPGEVSFEFKGGVPSKKKGRGLSRADKRLLVARKFSAKRKVYENCRMLSQDGSLLCFCDMRKVRWYEAKGLGKRICDDPPTIQLNFEHKIGDQDTGQDAFYTASRDNRCVVCASKVHLLRYRVVPACYRKNFPVHQKSHRSHDVVLLCFNCHEAAQKSAEQVKKEIARDTGVPLTPPLHRSLGSGEGLPPPYQIRHAAVALRAAGEKMPHDRQELLEGLIKKYLNGIRFQELRHGEIGSELAYPGSNLSLTMLDEALMAGLGPKRRKQNLRRIRERNKRIEEEKQAAEGPWKYHSGSDIEANDSEGRLNEAQGSQLAVSEQERSSSAQRERPQEAGHMWHGRQVVETLMARGGEDAVNSMIQKFRAAFVEATDPKHLPPFWQVDHK